MTEPWHNSPLPEGVSHAVTVPPGRGGWALWRPLRTNTDRNTGRGPPEQNRWRRPWRSWELWRPWRCRELRRPWQVIFGALASARPAQPEPFLPPPPFPGEVRGYQEPSGAKQTGQDRDRTTHRNRKPSWAKLGSWGFLWAWRGGRGPYRVPQQPLPSQRQGGMRLEWPPWPQQEEPPAPDESPWT